MPIVKSSQALKREGSVSLSCNAVHASLSEFLLETLSSLLLAYAAPLGAKVVAVDAVAVMR